MDLHFVVLSYLLAGLFYFSGQLYHHGNQHCSHLSAKKTSLCCINAYWQYIFVSLSTTGGNPVYFPFKWCHIHKKHASFFFDELMSDCHLAMLHSVMFPRSANGSCGADIKNIKLDCCTDGETFGRHRDGVRQHFRHWENNLVIIGVNANADVEMRLCNHWQSHIFTVWTKASFPEE